MHVHPRESCSVVVLLLCFIIRSCLTLKNDATEIFFSHDVSSVHDAQSNVSLNRARTGGRGLTMHERDERVPLGCRELRSTKYISDGQCTSVSPVKELVCTGQCLPAHMLPNWIGGYGRKFWSRTSHDWRCVNDKSRTQRIQLQCQDGSLRTYKITVVTSCKCKRYSRQHNDSGNKSESYAHAQMRKTKNKRGSGTMSV